MLSFHLIRTCNNASHPTKSNKCLSYVNGRKEESPHNNNLLTEKLAEFPLNVAQQFSKRDEMGGVGLTRAVARAGKQQEFIVEIVPLSPFHIL